VVNRYEYALDIADVFGLDKGLIEAVGSSFFPDIAPRPKNTSYVTLKMEEDLAIAPLGLREGLEEMRKMRGFRNERQS
jgi:dTDP-4-dehydrorhamnose reductase